MLAVRKSTPKDRIGLELSQTIFIVGAEPVRTKAVQNFIDTYKPHGLQPKNIYISFGMAEHVLLVSL